MNKSILAFLVILATNSFASGSYDCEVRLLENEEGINAAVATASLSIGEMSSYHRPVGINNMHEYDYILSANYSYKYLTHNFSRVGLVYGYEIDAYRSASRSSATVTVYQREDSIGRYGSEISSEEATDKAFTEMEPGTIATVEELAKLELNGKGTTTVQIDGYTVELSCSWAK